MTVLQIIWSAVKNAVLPAQGPTLSPAERSELERRRTELIRRAHEIEAGTYRQRRRPDG